MEMTNNGDLAIDKPKEYPVIAVGTYAAEYKGFKPFSEEAPWGHSEGARLQFQILKGPYKGQYVSFKGNKFQDNATGKWIIGRKSKLANVIRLIAGGENLNKGHEGAKLFIVVGNKTTKSGQNAGKPYAFVEQVMPLPADYPIDTPAATADPAPVQRPAPAPAPAPAPVAAAPAAQPAPAPAAAPAAQPAPQSNADLLGDLASLDDLSDFGK